jgi:hypothetical protein
VDLEAATNRGWTLRWMPPGQGCNCSALCLAGLQLESHSTAGLTNGGVGEDPPDRGETRLPSH